MDVKNLAFVSTAILLLVGCGGGSDEAAVDTGFSLPMEPGKVVATRTTTDKPFTYSAAGNYMAVAQQCGPAAASYDVQETPNAVVYSDGSVPVADLVTAAQYAESSIISLRDLFKLPASIGVNGEKFRVCVSRNTRGGGAVYNTMLVERRSDPQLKQLIAHEMVHAFQSFAMKCTRSFLPEEKWFVEGMAEAISTSSRDTVAEIKSTRQLFTGPTGSPFDEINARVAPNFSKYPAYTVAYDIALRESKKTHADAFAFLQEHGEVLGCNPTSGTNGWKSRFDQKFGVNLRGTGPLGSGFWDALSK